MHIKSLKVQGFKSFRDETHSSFSAGLNLLVGRNGSGKSNFFSAIRFVLSDAYTSLTREERQALLHDGSTAGGGATMSAFVEIEFDNADGRFPTNKPTLLLRRTIGLKKDEYQLDRKSTSKAEVMSVLESAGFSRSNPYYIVPQGRITNLTNQKDQDRLLLLKEVAGTKVYEERRSESMKIMDETEAKRQKISDLLEFIQDRLTELEEEKEELKQFQVQDRNRRSLEYSIYQRELKDVGDAFEMLEEDRRRDVDNANTKRVEFNDREKEMSELDTLIDSQRQRLALLQLDNRQASADRREAVKAKAQVECIVRDAEEASKRGKDTLGQLEVDLERVEAEIAEKETELMEVAPDLEDKLREESAANERIEAAETTLRTLLAKQGRTTQFKNQKDRDAHLRNEISTSTSLIATREKQESENKRSLDAARAELEEVMEGRRNQRKEIDGRKSLSVELAREHSELKEKHNTLLEKRKDLWKAAAKVESSSRHANEQHSNATRTLNSTMDKGLSTGLRAAKSIAERLDLDGYYGPLYSLFTVEDRYKTSVEAVAGTSLFNIVVDNDETASKIVDIMTKEKSGRVTMIPLNRLKPKNIVYPNAKEAIPMIKKLTFDATYNLAFEQVFGKTIICQSLEVAGAYVRSHNLDSITLEGDKYDRKGSITGGYHDVRSSRIDAIKNLKLWETKAEEEKKNHDEIEATTQRLNQEITQLVGAIHVCEGKLSKATADGAPLVASMLLLQQEEDALKTRIAKLEANLNLQQSAIRNLKAEMSAYEDELKTKMEQSLSDEEEQQLATLNALVDQTKEELLELSARRVELTGRRDIIEIDLNESLRRRRDELRLRIETYDVEGGQVVGGEDIAARRNEVANLSKSIEELNAKIDKTEADIESTTVHTAALEKEKERKDGQQNEDMRNIEKQQKSVERYLKKRQQLSERKDECNKNIRDLGVLPEEAFVETTASMEKLLKRLHRAHEALKGFAHVNKKAYEQYTTFTKQRDELTTRRDELNTSADSITELIDVLDMRKDEAIERTFKQVSKNFAEVFEKLVPAGKGRLIMQKREEQPDEDMDEEEDAARQAGVESYTGVAIRVSFNSKQNEGLKIQQLSGGQKALVALAMIFAIQKCDPAPFYLFDEIDANLDADRRTGVAAMINELSSTGQYICTTFRPELIQHASSCFGVFFDARKISTTKEITAEECMTFVDASEKVREDK